METPLPGAGIRIRFRFTEKLGRVILNNREDVNFPLTLSPTHLPAAGDEVIFPVTGEGVPLIVLARRFVFRDQGEPPTLEIWLDFARSPEPKAVG